MRDTTIAIGVWLLSASSCMAQNCIISGTTNYGAITQTCIIQGPTHANLAFDPAIAEELANRLPPGKPIRALAVGKEHDWEVASQYLDFLQKRGFQITQRDATRVAIPEPEHPITIFDNLDFVNLQIAPSMRY